MDLALHISSSNIYLMFLFTIIDGVYFFKSLICIDMLFFHIMNENKYIDKYYSGLKQPWFFFLLIDSLDMSEKMCS